MDLMEKTEPILLKIFMGALVYSKFTTPFQVPSNKSKTPPRQNATGFFEKTVFAVY